MHGLAMPRIDYSIRPAKSVERKMLAEALSRLSKLERPDNYRYVGFGAIYFRDFSLFHKMLGIHDMKSIEHNRSEETRFWSNRPFRCVEMLFGPSRVELPKAGLDEKKTGSITKGSFPLMCLRMLNFFVLKLWQVAF